MKTEAYEVEVLSAFLKDLNIFSLPGSKCGLVTAVNDLTALSEGLKLLSAAM